MGCLCNMSRLLSRRSHCSAIPSRRVPVPVRVLMGGAPGCAKTPIRCSTTCRPARSCDVERLHSRASQHLEMHRPSQQLLVTCHVLVRDGIFDVTKIVNSSEGCSAPWCLKK